MKVIFALGNPGTEYQKTRHNTGFVVLDTFAGDNKWQKQSKFNSLITEMEICGEKVLLVKPQTFYNETGIAIQKIISFYKLDQSSDLLVIHDDLSLPFGTIRIREKGSDAGNNGIKSINTYIDEKYWRIRIGILYRDDLRETLGDTDFVLAKFSLDESKQMKSTVIPKVIELINKFVTDCFRNNQPQLTKSRTAGPIARSAPNSRMIAFSNWVSPHLAKPKSIRLGLRGKRIAMPNSRGLGR